MNDYKSIAQEIINKAMDYSSQAMSYFDKEEIEEFAEDLAEGLGFKSYGDSCVIDVKGRPRLNFDAGDIAKKLNLKESTVYDIEHAVQEKLDFEIEAFAQDLEQDYSDFVIEGRMGGYWGLSNFYWNIDISPIGRAQLIKELENAYIQLINKEDKSQEQINEDMEDDVQYAYDYFTAEIYDTLLEDKSNFKLNADYLFELEQISKRIDEKEAELANIDTWVKWYQENKEV